MWSTLKIKALGLAFSATWKAFLMCLECRNQWSVLVRNYFKFHHLVFDRFIWFNIWRDSTANWNEGDFFYLITVSRTRSFLLFSYRNQNLYFLAIISIGNKFVWQFTICRVFDSPQVTLRSYHQHLATWFSLPQYFSLELGLFWGLGLFINNMQNNFMKSLTGLICLSFTYLFYSSSSQVYKLSQVFQIRLKKAWLVI